MKKGCWGRLKGQFRGGREEGRVEPGPAPDEDLGEIPEKIEKRALGRKRNPERQGEGILKQQTSRTGNGGEGWLFDKRVKTVRKLLWGNQ